MALHAYSTSAPEVRALPPHPRTLSGRRAARRALLEDIAHRAIAALDALDAPTAEREPEEDDDALPEASAQPVTLAPDRAPARRVRRSHPFRRPGSPPPAGPPVSPPRPTPNSPPRRPARSRSPIPASGRRDLAALFGVRAADLANLPDAGLVQLCGFFAHACRVDPATGGVPRVRGALAEKLIVARPATLAGLVAKADAALLAARCAEDRALVLAFSVLADLSEGIWA